MLRRGIASTLLALAVWTSGCGGPKEPTQEDFKAGLEEAGKAAERGRELQQGKGGVPPVPDPAN